MEENQDVCQVHCTNANMVELLKGKMLQDEEVLGLSELFKAVGDGTRIRILHGLSQEELCVCDLAQLLEMSQSAVSHQLRVLRNLRLVKHRKEGKMVYYSLDDEHIFNLFAQGLAHIQHK